MFRQESKKSGSLLKKNTGRSANVQFTTAPVLELQFLENKDTFRYGTDMFEKQGQAVKNVLKKY
jgi:hypothetical protein